MTYPGTRIAFLWLLLLLLLLLLCSVSRIQVTCSSYDRVYRRYRSTSGFNYGGTYCVTYGGTCDVVSHVRTAEYSVNTTWMKGWWNVCLCVCVCVCACVRACVLTWAPGFSYIRVRLGSTQFTHIYSVCAHVHACTYVYLYVCLPIKLCLYSYWCHTLLKSKTRVRARTPMHTHTHTYTHTHTQYNTQYNTYLIAFIILSGSISLQYKPYPGFPFSQSGYMSS